MFTGITAKTQALTNVSSIEQLERLKFKEVERRVSLDLGCTDKILKNHPVAKSDLVIAVGYLLDALKEMELYIEGME